MKTIGIIGGGQLAWMLAIEAKKLGYKTICLDPNPKASASYVVDEMIVAPYENLKAVELLCQKSDVVTYEFENVDACVIKNLQEEYNIVQGYLPLYISQNRLREKQAAEQSGLKVPKYLKIMNQTELIAGINKIGYPAILKTSSGGYDGKNQYWLKSHQELPIIQPDEYILEQVIDFDFEVSIIAFRNIKNEFTHLPIARNVHQNGILYYTTVPADISTDLERQIIDLAKQFMVYHQFIGIITLELFIKGNEIYFNEMAPRPHNSGHYSLDVCDQNQYTLLLAAILNQPLGEVVLKTKALMLNILGQDVKRLKKLCDTTFPFKHYDYLKDVMRNNRKVGHITYLNATKEQLQFIK